MLRSLALAALLLITACGDDRPPAPTAAEQQQLDEADAMLDNFATNEKGPEASAPDPSDRSTE